MTVAGSFQIIDLNDWTSTGGESFREGSLRLFHTGKALNIGAHIQLVHESTGRSFEEKLQEIGRFDSRQLEGVWWMPSQQAEAKIILSNTADISLTVSARLSKRPQQVGNPQSFALLPHQTKVLDLRQDFENGNQFPNSDGVGISLQHTGEKSALAARALVGELQTGYSAVIPFANPSAAKSRKYDGAGLKLEKINGEKLKPIVAVRNTGTAQAKVSAKALYTRADGTRGTVTLPESTLTGKEIKLLNVQQLIQRADNENIAVAGIEINYDAAPGSVITQVQSVGEERDYVFRVIMWDAPAQRSSTGTYPWYIDQSSTTKAYIKNTTNLEQQYLSLIKWENGGKYVIGLKTLTPGETVEIDVKRLRDEQIPNDRGQTIPLDTVRGQIDWSIRVRPEAPVDDLSADLALVGQMEQTDFINKFSSQYFCQSCCAFSPSLLYITLASMAPEDFPPLSLEVETGEGLELQLVEKYVTCYGSGVPDSYYYFSVPGNWSSANPGIASLTGDNYGFLVGNSPGQTTGISAWTTYNYIATGTGCPDGPGCNACTRTDDFVKTATTPLIVKPPTVIMSPSQTKVDGEEANFSVTVENATPTGYQWSFEAPSDAGNNPQVNFDNPNAASVKAKAHWFAKPNDPCTASSQSTYKIKVRVSFAGRSPITKERLLTVTVPTPEGGRTDTVNGITGFPAYETNRRTGVLRVTGIGSLQRVRQVTKSVFVPSTSQFFSKLDEHEDVHVEQWQSEGLLGVHFDPAKFYNRIQNFTAPNLTALQGKINTELQKFLDAEQALVNGKLNQSEREAYAVSDPLTPQYAFQRCGKFSN